MQADHDQCATRCAGDTSDLQSISLEGARLLGECVQGLSCNALVEPAWSESFSSCWKQSSARIRPRASVRAFCGNFSHSLFECGQWLSVDDCAHAYSLRSDSFVSGLRSCLEKANCEQLTACIAAQVGA